MLFKPLFSSRKTNSFKIRKDSEYLSKPYKIHLSRYEKDRLENMLEKDTIKMRFLLSNNIHDLKYLVNYGVDKDNYGLYSLFSSGTALASVQNNFSIYKLDFNQPINIFLLFKNENIDITLIRRIFMEEIPAIEITKGILKYYKNFNHHKIENSNSVTKLLNTNVFELIKSRYKDNDKRRRYKNLMKKFVSGIPDLIKEGYINDMFLYKNVITDNVKECTINLESSMALLLHYLPKLYVGISLTHKPYLYVDLNDVQYIKTLFILFQVIGNDMKLSVYEYYVAKKRGIKGEYKILLDIDLNGTKYYNSIFPEIKTYFDNMKNEKVVLISSY